MNLINKQHRISSQIKADKGWHISVCSKDLRTIKSLERKGLIKFFDDKFGKYYKLV